MSYHLSNYITGFLSSRITSLVFLSATVKYDCQSNNTIFQFDFLLNYFWDCQHQARQKIHAKNPKWGMLNIFIATKIPLTVHTLTRTRWVHPTLTWTATLKLFLTHHSTSARSRHLSFNSAKDFLLATLV